MTRDEFKECMRVAAGLWPRWTLNDIRIDELWSMLGNFTLDAVLAAMRRHFHEEPDTIKPSLKVVRVYVGGALRNAGLDKVVESQVDELIEFHRISQWPVPPRNIVAAYVLRGEMMPIQLCNFAKQAAAIKTGLEGRAMEWPDETPYRQMELRP